VVGELTSLGCLHGGWVSTSLGPTRTSPAAGAGSSSPAAGSRMEPCSTALGPAGSSRPRMEPCSTALGLGLGYDNQMVGWMTTHGIDGMWKPIYDVWV
jgi:hypothetical protein